MGEVGINLLVAILLFGASAVVVVFSGLNLAKYGDLLAGKTGWGRLWVGTLLIAIATSLPELATAVSAARIDSPELALGNVFGANMLDMTVLAFVALLFGATRFFNQVAPQQGYLATVAISLTGLAVVMGVVGMSSSVADVGLGALLILLLYIGGMRLVYLRRPPEDETSPDADAESTITLRRTWLFFGLASLAVLVSAPVLAWSADQIADSTGLSAGFVGLVAVAAVTAMPEATVTVAAVRLGAIDLAVGNLYGSTAFNILALAIADPFYDNGPILDTMKAEHVAGGLFAVLLLTLPMTQFLVGRSSRWRLPPVPASVAMCLIYLGGLFTVFLLG